ncbi:prenylated Rab acceptor [Nesidiocoris tenuis]|uniref:PRA1 family protein n=1 Tax=Nesidiocoris tenuis TaxID=355587 RepID=A0ABN7B4S7_9HEMI|nr:prenylated Rab acceptor [Nesidiocoris tenuis]
MTDAAIDLSGELSAPIVLDKGGTFSFPGLNRVPTFHDFVQSSRDSIRPWGQFVNTSNFKAPPNFSRLLKRAVNNIKYFQGNYIVIALTLMAYCLLTSPLLLLSVAASLIGCYLLSLRNAEKKMRFGNKEVTLQQQYGIVGLCSLPLYYWAGVGQAVFWVIGASCFVVGLHAGAYSIEEVLPPEDQLSVLLQV